MSKRLKAAALSTIAVAIVAAIMLCPQAAANATVVNDDIGALTSWTGDIFEKNMSTGGTVYLSLYSQYNADIFDGMNIYFEDSTGRAVWFTIDVNYNTSSVYFSVAIYANSNWTTFENIIIVPIAASFRFTPCVYFQTTYIRFTLQTTVKTVSGNVTGLSSQYPSTRYVSITGTQGIGAYGAYNVSQFASGTGHNLYYGVMGVGSFDVIYYADKASYSDGYSDGYNAGSDDWDSFVGWDWLKAAISIIGTVLTLEIAPDIYLGYFVALPLILGAVIFVLQFKR